MAGCWDLTPSPVLLAGADGSVHETRPTTSLARDLAAEPEVQEIPRSTGVRRQSDPDARPLRGFVPSRLNGATSKDSCRAVGHPVSHDHAPLSGFTNAKRSPGAPKQRSTIGGCPNMATPSRGVTKGSSIGLQRRSLKPYAPIDLLLGMGFDEDSARIAIAAAGGDVSRAVRIALEDSQAHDARSSCEWEFEGDSGWVPFDRATESIIKASAARGETACEIRTGGNWYLVDFESRTQLNMVTNRTRRIRKR